MATTITRGSKIIAAGAPAHFAIVDRVGLNIEVIPRLVGAAFRPTGQRGLLALWRNTSRLFDANAFRVLVSAR